jgi:hypothetical protein
MHPDLGFFLAGKDEADDGFIDNEGEYDGPRGGQMQNPYGMMPGGMGMPGNFYGQGMGGIGGMPGSQMGASGMMGGGYMGMQGGRPGDTGFRGPPGPPGGRPGAPTQVGDDASCGGILVVMSL